MTLTLYYNLRMLNRANVSEPLPIKNTYLIEFILMMARWHSPYIVFLNAC